MEFEPSMHIHNHNFLFSMQCSYCTIDFIGIDLDHWMKNINDCHSNLQDFWII